MVKDLNSRNGSFVDGARLSGAVPLRVGMRLQLGPPSCTWRVEDLGAATVAVIDDQGFASHGAPDGIEIENVLLIEQDASEGWLLSDLSRDDGVTRVVSDGETVPIGERRFRVSLPELSPVTQLLDQPDIVTATLRLSRDPTGEYIRGQVLTGGTQFELPTHSYMLVVDLLASLRAEDLARGIAPDEAGWTYVDELIRGLGRPWYRKRLNVEVKRLRDHLVETGFSNGRLAVERRTATDQLRLGFGTVERD